LPNYSYIGRCFVAVHDLNLNIWSSFSVPSCITKRLPMWKISFMLMCFFLFFFTRTTQLIWQTWQNRFGGMYTVDSVSACCKVWPLVCED
jgi:hypothetical protein